MLHVHVLFVAPLGAGRMAQPGTGQHESRVTVRETAHHTSAAADLLVQPFNDIIGADTSPVFTQEIAIGEGLLDLILHPLSGLLQLHGTESFRHSFSLFPGSFFALLSVDRLEHLGHQLHFGARRNSEHIAVEVDDTPLVFGLRKHLSHSFQHTKTLIYACGNQTVITDALGGKTTSVYDANGNLTSVTDAAGNTTRYTYDKLGQVTSTTDAEGHTTYVSYDPNGNINKLTQADGHEITYTYNARNELTSYVDAEGYTHSFTYDGNGNVTSETDGNGNTTVSIRTMP